MKELAGIIAQLASMSDLKGLLVVSKKPDIFIAGADIKEIETITSSPEARLKAEEGQKILNMKKGVKPQNSKIAFDAEIHRKCNKLQI